MNYYPQIHKTSVDQPTNNTATHQQLQHASGLLRTCSGLITGYKALLILPCYKRDCLCFLCFQYHSYKAVTRHLTMARSSFFTIALLLVGAACMVSADGPHWDPSSSGVDIEDSCEAAVTCYYSTACRDYDDDKESEGDRGTPFRECFFDCLDSRVDSSSDSEEFIDYVKDVQEWCEEKRGDDAPEGKVMKCTLHKIKKDACDEYFTGSDDRK